MPSRIPKNDFRNSVKDNSKSVIPTDALRRGNTLLLGILTVSSHFYVADPGLPVPDRPSHQGHLILKLGSALPLHVAMSE